MPAATDWSDRSRELAQLLARAGLGDRAAFATLYERTSAHLFAVVLRINRDRAQAEDILQEVYVNVWRSAQSFDAAQSQPLTWLTSVARNRAIDSLRRAQSQPQIQTAFTSGGDDAEETDVYDQVADDSAGPLELLSRAADARALTHCMEGLSSQQRQSVALAFFDGLSHAEVADQLRQPLGTVKSWVRRALMALKGCLEAAVQRDMTGPGRT
ncbi:sigma-70 family RNA polymerase sigma factor [Rhizobacter sp. AJA081-3]|uniref:sigma-70 family RNA polymerase sigma factor n=1 Tax=Rhizobacter sp. AJA081-3 TaxID=2753607 RepID=UPI001ADEE8AC|nr:sigma-70 family RNA polymerase sigma factor [Rhizobacter sp. AJA081-3]QTN23200.1 sigma-70 family RNA polymerase sigma factor [Rhizobacter sp. AJA081-3]